MTKLDSCVFPVGTEFIVSPLIKSGVFPPFSAGFIGNFNGQFKNSPNVIILNATLIRKGKRGKQRIENILLTTQVFDIEIERKGLKLDEFKGYPFVHITNAENTYSNVMDMEPLEFLGWGTAHLTYLAELYKDADVAKRWPRGNVSPINIMMNMGDRFYNDPAGALNLYAAEDFRTNFTQELRMMETSVAKTVLQYKLTLSAAELKAAAYLLWDNLREEDKLYDKVTVANNYNFYRQKHITLQHLMFKMHTARYESFINKKKESNLNYQIDKPALMAKVARPRTLIKLFAKWIKTGGGSPRFQHFIFHDSEKATKDVEKKAVRAEATYGVPRGMDRVEVRGL